MLASIKVIQTQDTGKPACLMVSIAGQYMTLEVPTNEIAQDTMCRLAVAWTIKAKDMLEDLHKAVVYDSED